MRSIVNNNQYQDTLYEFFSYVRTVNKDQGEFVNDGVTNSLKEVQKLHDQAVNEISRVLASK